MPNLNDAQLKIREKELEVRRLELEMERMRLEAGSASDGDTLESSRGKGGRFRLLAGGHIDDNGVEYKQGQVVACDYDLGLRFGDNKFQRISVFKDAKDPDGGIPVEENPKTVGGKRVKLEDENRRKALADQRQKLADDEQVRRSLPPEASLPQVSGRGVPTGPSADDEDADQSEGGKATAELGELSDNDDEKGGGTDQGGETTENLDGMSIAELKEIAEAEEIDLHGAVRKADILARIRASRG